MTYLAAHVPFIGETCVFFLADRPKVTASLTREDTKRWGFEDEDLYSIAIPNLAERSEDLPNDVSESPEGGKATLIQQRDGYDAERLLLPDLHERTPPALSTEFLVAIPACDILIAVRDGADSFISRVKKGVADDYTRLGYPISTELFRVVRGGIAAETC